MPALETSRKVPEREGQRFSGPALNDNVIYKGAMVAMTTAGFIDRAAATASLRVVGVAQETVDNTDGSDGDLQVPYKSGIFRMENSAPGADEVTEALAMGHAVYAVNDNVVALTDGSGARPVAGICVGVDDDGVWVDIGPRVLATSQGAAASEAQPVSLFISTNVSATGYVARYVHTGPSRRITAIRSVISAALATGDMTITAAINGTPVTGGVVTVTQSGSAAGDIDVATPSAANTITEGQQLTLTVGGTNTGAGHTDVTVELSPV